MCGHLSKWGYLGQALRSLAGSLLIEGWVRLVHHLVESVLLKAGCHRPQVHGLTMGINFECGTPSGAALSAVTRILGDFWVAILGGLPRMHVRGNFVASGLPLL